MIVSKPVWESAAYDFVVEAVSRQPSAVRKRKKPKSRRGRRRRLWRVQVKSVRTMIRRGYTISTHGSRNRVYGPDEFDFFAAWVAPLDTWYIIPAWAVLPARSAALYPHVTGSWGKYEKFREAWHLLAGGRKGQKIP